MSFINMSSGEPRFEGIAAKQFAEATGFEAPTDYTGREGERAVVGNILAVQVSRTEVHLADRVGGDAPESPFFVRSQLAS